jgi:hypothetical protein
VGIGMILGWTAAFFGAGTVLALALCAALGSSEARYGTVHDDDVDLDARDTIDGLIAR